MENSTPSAPYEPSIDENKIVVVHQVRPVKQAAKDIAYQIFYNTVVLQSMSIKGFEANENGTFATGDLVIKELEALDVKENWTSGKDGVCRRKRTKPRNCIGGWDAQRQFKILKETRDSIPVYTIWRTQ